MGISVSEVVGGSVRNPLPQRVLMNSNEQIKIISTAQILHRHVWQPGVLLITNQRVIFVQDSNGRVVLDVAVESLQGVGEEKNVLVGKNLRDVVKVTRDGASNLINLLTTAPPSLSAQTVTESIMLLRQAIFGKTQSPSGQDFSWLKDFLDKGGVKVTAVKCPNCAGTVEVPKEGSFTKCKYCGQTLYVEDILKVIRGLSGNSMTEGRRQSNLGDFS